MTDHIVVPARFHGPDGSGNGGYVAGLLAARAAGVTEVTLRVPPPLETRLDVRQGAGGLELFAGPTLVAQAVPAEVSVEVPAPVDVDSAATASMGYAGLTGHPFPRCFVCGPERADGLRIFPGLVSGRSLVAAPWVPAAEFADVAGFVRAEFVSAALDCAGAWSLDLDAAHPLVLGRFAVRVDAPVRAGAPHIVIGWPLAVDGRKRFAATALMTAAGETVAVAEATWIALRQR